MPSTPGVDVPPDAAAVAGRYRRLERPVSGAVALFVGIVAVGALLSLPLLQGLAVAVMVLAAVRVPVFRSSGTARLVTDAAPTAVRSDFGGPTPLPLALQWGVAEAVRRTDGGAVYDVSYLFGLRSTTMAVEALPLDDASEDLELVLTAGGRPWATYAVSVEGADSGTVVDVELRSDRRFGLRRLPQWLVAERYREAALAAQGYEVATRNVGLSL